MVIFSIRLFGGNLKKKPPYIGGTIEELFYGYWWK